MVFASERFVGSSQRGECQGLPFAGRLSAKGDDAVLGFST